ncbi:MAG: glycoside hydrolase family 127 protein [Bacteroidaceae bacterium]|nr:glycoside hydrolase family 127 protein [Bacteroidaceae bacterium]
MRIRNLTLLLLAMLLHGRALAQSELYPQHFDLTEVTLLDSPLKTAMDGNARLLLQYDADRLLAPFIRQAGLHTKSGSKYYGWLTAHPSFSNWGLSSWSLEGHVGGHYLTALALAYAAERDEALRQQLKERLDYCVSVLKDCQDAFATNTQGLKGFIGGQPINQIWTGLYANDLTEFRKYGGWVPFYCEHKVLAGLRDAWIYAGNETARECFRGLADWSVEVISKLSDTDMETVLGWEHGGMNEVIADAFCLFGDMKYLEAAKRYSHKYEINGMQGNPYNAHFLDNQHANTQVPKYIGFERVWRLYAKAKASEDMSAYRTAALNFWDDVATHRTVCIGGNSTSEHFFDPANGQRYINDLDGPESCNSNNMLKFSEALFDDTHDARYADFYEQTMYNHILSTRDPDTGGYVYFTTLRPQGYRIYSTVNQSMWCCVGTGMENHSKYGHFIYTHDGSSTLYVNLFVASELDNETFGIRQETTFPYPATSDLVASTQLTVTRAGTYTIAVRHPAWVTNSSRQMFYIKVNGEEMNTTATEGKASYVHISRTWQVGDVIDVNLPMNIYYEECPGLPEYIAFKAGPILLGAMTIAGNDETAKEWTIQYPKETLQNEYGGEGRMDHAPGSRASVKDLTEAPLLIDADRSQTLGRITWDKLKKLKFIIDASSEQSKRKWARLRLVPFFTIHHGRYMCYWYSATPEAYAQSDMGKADAEAAALAARTLDFVATGEQQSEAGHNYEYSSDSSVGTYNGETYRDAQRNGYIQYTLANPEGITEGVAVMLRLTTADKGRQGVLTVDGTKIADVTVAASVKTQDAKGFYNAEFPIPTALLLNDDGTPKVEITVRLTASATTLIPGLYYLRLVKGYNNDYVFHARDWVTGDAGRVSQSNISYDDQANTLTVHATGSNNVALNIDWAHLDYEINAAQKFLIVKGSNLARTSGASYLWWLNGVNKGSQVAPTSTKVASDGDIIVAWNMNSSGLSGNNTGDRFSICKGHTIFGLTSTTGTSVIRHIGFYESVAAFETATAINDVALKEGNQPTASNTYIDLSGRQAIPRKGIYIINGKKVVLQ